MVSAGTGVRRAGKQRSSLGRWLRTRRTTLLLLSARTAAYDTGTVPVNSIRCLWVIKSERFLAVYQAKASPLVMAGLGREKFFKICTGRTESACQRSHEPAALAGEERFTGVLRKDDRPDHRRPRTGQADQPPSRPTAGQTATRMPGRLIITLGEYHPARGMHLRGRRVGSRTRYTDVNI